MSQTLILTCRECAGTNPRVLPYSMAKPDWCQHCGHAFRTTFDIAMTELKLWRKQSKLASAAEAVVNTSIGFVIAWVAQWIICWAYSIPMNNHQLTIMVFWMTLISVVRSYVIRRLWNKEFWRRGN